MVKVSEFFNRLIFLVHQSVYQAHTWFAVNETIWRLHKEWRGSVVIPVSRKYEWITKYGLRVWPDMKTHNIGVEDI